MIAQQRRTELVPNPALGSAGGKATHRKATQRRSVEKPQGTSVHSQTENRSAVLCDGLHSVA